MKATRTTLKSISTLVIVLGLATLVAGAGLVISNTLNMSNQVGQGATLTLSDAYTASHDYPNWTSGAMGVEDTRDFNITLQGHGSYDVLVKFSIYKAGMVINSTDVEVAYWDSGWNIIPLTDMGSTLEGAFGPPVTGFPIWNGYNVTTTLTVTYSVLGSYVTDVWVEMV